MNLFVKINFQKNDKNRRKEYLVRDYSLFGPMCLRRVSKAEYLVTRFIELAIPIASILFLIYALVAYWDYIPYIFR